MKLEYFIVLFVCFAGPFFLSFSRKIAFYKKPRRLFISIFFPMIIFIAWDMIAVWRGHWRFNENYISGLFIFNLPLEEIMFFIIIPFCALFTWEVVKFYSENNK
jgi:lycopene cyclase domain-containing protein